MKKLFSALPDDICLSEVNIPGTHDSCTAFCTMENMCRCQSLTVKEQLEKGIRLFDIRLYRSGKDFYLCHSLADCFTDATKKTKLTFDAVLEDFCEFLRDNPDEALIVSIKQDRGIMNRLFFPAFYERYIEGNEAQWYLDNGNPTLKQCRGKMVLMRRCKVFPWWKKDKKCGLDFSCWKDQGSKRKEKIYTVVQNKSLKAVVQDRYGLAPERKWNKCENPFLDSCVCDKNNISVHFISTAFRYKNESLVKTAKEMNALFKIYNLKGKKGWFFFDFPDEEIVDKVTESNFDIYKEKTT